MSDVRRSGEAPAAIVVRRAEPGDWRIVRELRLGALADSPGAFITTLADARGYPDQLWRDRIAGHPHFLVERDGDPVGMSTVLTAGAFAELVGVWVRPDARGSGAIDGLVDAAVSCARVHGLTELRLWVVEGNGRAERAYLRLGFVRTGARQPVPGRRDETEVEMTLAI